jgi:hypothetical protein
MSPAEIITFPQSARILSLESVPNADQHMSIEKWHQEIQTELKRYFQIVYVNLQTKEKFFTVSIRFPRSYQSFMKC